MAEVLNPIAVVERETGIGKDTLRVWERRYGFPQPARGPNGDRLYPEQQVSRLRLLKRLIDSGHRPGALMKADPARLQDMVAAIAHSPENSGDKDAGGNLAALIGQLRAHDAGALRQHLSQMINRQGLQHFVRETLPTLNELIGEAWSRGELEVFEEHLYTEQMQAQLRQAIAALPTGRGSPRILLTSVPEERHGLGLLMLESLFTLEDASCISLGTQTPLAEIASAVRAQRIDVVALSFSAAFPQRQVLPLLADLRRRLPHHVELWAGGSGTRRVSAPEHVRLASSLSNAIEFLDDWRNNHERTP